MAGERLFLDASFVVARFSPRDQYHQAARQLAARADDCGELWTTEAVLLEIGAALAAPGQRKLRFAFGISSTAILVTGWSRSRVASWSGPWSSSASAQTKPGA